MIAFRRTLLPRMGIVSTETLDECLLKENKSGLDALINSEYTYQESRYFNSPLFALTIRSLVCVISVQINVKISIQNQISYEDV